MTSPVERTTKYATTVDTLPDAWAFVMSHLDELASLGPSVHISPFWVYGDGDETTRRFEVAVEGMQEIAP
jgi:hypothetical protein